MQKGDIVAANNRGFGYKNGAVGSVLKICGTTGKAIVRFSNGWINYRDQIVTMECFRIIPKGE